MQARCGISASEGIHTKAKQNGHMHLSNVLCQQILLSAGIQLFGLSLLFILTGAHSYSAWWLSICSILRKPLLIQ
jgi:hypothetical protein